MSETDSFIEEVTEELRRDRLYAMLRKYGWIAILTVVLIVGGAAYNEWRKASIRAASQALGDKVMTALAGATAEDRATAMTGIEGDNPQSQVFLGLLTAATRVEASDRDAALELLDAIAVNPDAPQIYRQLATLKAVILRGSDQDRTARMAALEILATPGNPFRVVALEQIALAHFEFGDNAAAIKTLRTILDEPDATQGLLQRAQQLIVALGGDLSEANGAGEDG